MNIKTGIRAALVALTLALPSASQAATVVDAGWTAADLDWQSWCSGCGGVYKTYAKFSLGGSYAITEASWASYPGYASDTVLEIWDATRSTLLFSQSSLAAAIVDLQTAPTVLERTMSVTGLLLNSGTYWISFFGQNNAFYGYGTATGEQVQSGWGTTVDTGTFGAFRLAGNSVSAVPLPATLPLMAAALGGFGLLRRKRRA